MNPVDILILLIIGGLLFLALRFLRRTKKQGGCPGCGGCSACAKANCKEKHEDSE